MSCTKMAWRPARRLAAPHSRRDPGPMIAFRGPARPPGREDDRRQSRTGPASHRGRDLRTEGSPSWPGSGVPARPPRGRPVSASMTCAPGAARRRHCRLARADPAGEAHLQHLAILALPPGRRSSRASPPRRAAGRGSCGRSTGLPAPPAEVGEFDGMPCDDSGRVIYQEIHHDADAALSQVVSPVSSRCFRGRASRRERSSTSSSEARTRCGPVPGGRRTAPGAECEPTLVVRAF